MTTEDGYILELHRISGGPKSPPRKGKRVCFLMHGLVFSSITFVFSGPDHALGWHLKLLNLISVKFNTHFSLSAYRLADEGYDVWLGNCRGSIYSVNHTKFKPFGSLKNQKKFWNYTLHEIGDYDLPASIDYVLNHTEQQKLHYLGHSQGCTTFFIMMSERPEMGEKIESMHALAPAVFLKHVKCRLVRSLKPFVSSLYVRFELFSMCSHIHLTLKLFPACKESCSPPSHLSSANPGENISKQKTNSLILWKSFELDHGKNWSNESRKSFLLI